MKSSPKTLARALDRPDPNVRFYLFHGYDPAQSRAHGERLLRGLGGEKVAIAAATLKSDRAALADQAAAIGLFGGKRALWIEPAGEEIGESVESLLETTAVESPAIAIAGPLRNSSRLLQLIEAHPLALAHQSYELSDRDTERLVEELAAAEGLRLAPGIAARIALAANNERGIIVQELGKLALYLDASPESPQLLDEEAFAAVGAGSEGEWAYLGDVALACDLGAVADALSRASGIDPVALLRAIQRRLLMLAPLRARVDQGRRPQDVVTSAGNAVFFKEKGLVAKLLSTWDSPTLAGLSERTGSLERKLMSAAHPPHMEAVGEELVAIARQAARR